MIDLSFWGYWTPQLLYKAVESLKEPDLQKAVYGILRDPEFRKHKHYGELFKSLRAQLKGEEKLAVILEFQLHQDMCQRLGKLKNLVTYPDGRIYDRETGVILTEVKYPQAYWTAEAYERHGWTKIYPMKALNASIPEGRRGVKEHKLDGVSTRCYIGDYGMRFFGPNDVQNGWVGEYSDKVPHLRELRLRFGGTILDGEFVHPCGVMPDRRSAGILNPNTKPETSWKKQAEEGWLIYVAYDVIVYRGVDVRNLPYWRRLELLEKIMRDPKTGLPHHECFLPIYSVPESGITIDGVWYSQSSYSRFIFDQGMEGTVWCDLDARYEDGARNKSKIKDKKIDPFDVVVMGYNPPEREADFTKLKTTPSEWKYWVDENDTPVPVDSSGTTNYLVRGITPVSKFYYYGWIGSAVFGVYDKKGNLVQVGSCSGMDEDVRKVFSSKKRKNMLRGNRHAIGKVIEVSGQLYDTENSIRWPEFVRFREDKDPRSCTLDALKEAARGKSHGN